MANYKTLVQQKIIKAADEMLKLISKTKDIQKLGETFYHLIREAEGTPRHLDISYFIDNHPRLKDDDSWEIVVKLCEGKYRNTTELKKDLGDLKRKIKKREKVTVIAKAKSKKIRQTQVKKFRIGDKEVRIGDKVEVINSGRNYPCYDEKAEELGATKWERHGEFGKRFGGRYEDGEKTGIIKNIDERKKIALIEVDNQEWLIGFDGLRLVKQKIKD